MVSSKSTWRATSRVQLSSPAEWMLPGERRLSTSPTRMAVRALTWTWSGGWVGRVEREGGGVGQQGGKEGIPSDTISSDTIPSDTTSSDTILPRLIPRHTTGGRAGSWVILRLDRDGIPEETARRGQVAPSEQSDRRAVQQLGAFHNPIHPPPVGWPRIEADQDVGGPFGSKVAESSCGGTRCEIVRCILS